MWKIAARLRLHRASAGAIALGALLLCATPLGSLPLARAACRDDGPGAPATNSSVLEFQYAGWLQTFSASDSILTEVSVWHTVPDTLYGGVSLYLGNVDPTGFADLKQPIAGPFVAPPSFATPGDPAPMVFSISPPVHLSPGRTYYFAVAIPAPGSIAAVGLATDSTGTAAPGSAWKWKFPRLPIEGGGIEASVHAGDLIYVLEYCDNVVSAASSTWGEIKTRYR